MYFGAHVSIAGGLPNAPTNAARLGCEVFQIFSRSPRGGWVAPLDKNIAAEFKEKCALAKQKEWYVHTPYFIHFGSAKKKIYNAAITVVREELERASLLGAAYVMTHMGSYKDLGKEKGFAQLVVGVDKMLKGYKGTAKFLIEIAAGAGDVIASNFEEVAEIIFHPKLIKYDIGVCFDTQHAFAGGYDLRSPQAVTETLDKFDKIIGLEKLKMSHCNDSKTELASRRDRHEHIGDGLIGQKGFAALVAEKRLESINFILETEPDKQKKDLEILKNLRAKYV